MKRTRVLLFVGNLGIGGTERNVLHLARRLDRRLFEVEVWCNYAGQPLQEMLERDGIPCRSLKQPSAGRHPLVRLFGHNLPYQARLYRLLRDNRDAILHVFGFPMTYYVALLAAAARARRVIYAVQDWDVWKRGPAYRLLDRVCSRCAARIIADGAGAARLAVKRQGMDPKKVTVIYDGVDTDELQPSRPAEETRRQLGLDADRVVVSLIARMDIRKKGQDVFLAAARRAAEQVPQLQFLLVGGGPDQGRVEMIAADLPDAARPVFAGFRTDLADLLAATDVLVLASRWESVPKILLEGMWMKRPIVATRVGDVEEVFDERAGRLVPPDDPQRMAEAIVSLAGDPDLRSRLGENGRRTILDRGLTLDRSIQRVQEEYLRLAKR
jgi:glycosyltransferase involved in cell wall biosynthesis